MSLGVCFFCMTARLRVFVFTWRHGRRSVTRRFVDVSIPAVINRRQRIKKTKTPVLLARREKRVIILIFKLDCSARSRNMRRMYIYMYTQTRYSIPCGTVLLPLNDHTACPVKYRALPRRCFRYSGTRAGGRCERASAATHQNGYAPSAPLSSARSAVSYRGEPRCGSSVRRPTAAGDYCTTARLRVATQSAQTSLPLNTVT